MNQTEHVPPTAAGRPYRILVFDADANARRAVREALIIAGYDVHETLLAHMDVLVGHRTQTEEPGSAICAITEARRYVASNPLSNDSSSVTHPVVSSYSRRRGEYVYNIDVYESVHAVTADHFRAHVMNMVLLEAGQTVLVNPDLQDEYGPTPQRALSRIEHAVDEWMLDHTPLH
jgi:hypothetical protein